jgi:hypothetical protein
MLAGDPDCVHRAAYWHAQGVLDLDREPEPPAPAAFARVVCFRCNGAGRGCPVCAGAGAASLAAQAVALVAAANEPAACGLCIGAGWDDETGRPCGLCGGTGIEPADVCDECGGPLDDEAQADDALITLCGECVAADCALALTARRSAVSAVLAA